MLQKYLANKYNLEAAKYLQLDNAYTSHKLK